MSSSGTLYMASAHRPPPDKVMSDDDDFGADVTLDDDLEAILLAAESQGPTVPTQAVGETVQLGTPESVDVNVNADIEDLITLSPFEQFRKKGWLSVSDLVGTVWCEVQVSTPSPAQTSASLIR